jgi:hypothetical protein
MLTLPAVCGEALEAHESFSCFLFLESSHKETIFLTIAEPLLLYTHT